jgi:hypothetical protein
MVMTGITPRYRRYLTDVAGELVGISIVLAISVAVSLCALYFGKSLWWVYLQTPIGQEYAKLFEEQALIAGSFYAGDLPQLAVDLNVLILEVGLTVGVVSRLLFLKTFLYDAQSTLGRWLFWFVPFSFTIAYLLQRTYAVEWSSSLLMSLIPSAILFGPCLEVAATILPDGVIVKGIHRAIVETGCTLRDCSQE